MDVLKRMPWLAQEAVFQRTASIADVASLSKQERIAYDENLRKYRDTIAVMEGQWMEGRAEERKDNARKMKGKGYAIEDIAEITGLTKEEIAQL